jgi:hypothetical protein
MSLWLEQERAGRGDSRPLRLQQADPRAAQHLAAWANKTPSALSCAAGPHQQGTAMNLSKREQSRIERTLAATLTDACEAGKAELVGFVWLTHQVDYQQLPSSLKVVWVFDTQTNRDQALAAGQNERMLELTAEALSDADISVGRLADHVHFDSEEQCQRADAGNWQQRLARMRSVRP